MNMVKRVSYRLEVWSLSCFKNLESSSNFTLRWTTLKSHKRQKNHLGHMTLTNTPHPTAQLKLVNLCWCRKHPSAIYHWSGHIRTVRYISTWLWYTNLTANIIGIAPSPPNIVTRTRYYSTANPAILGQNRELFWMGQDTEERRHLFHGHQKSIRAFYPCP